MYTKLKKESTVKSYGKRALILLFTLAVIATVAIFAYDGPGGDEPYTTQYGYIDVYEYDYGYIGDAPHSDGSSYYYENGYDDGYNFDTELYFGMTILSGWPIESILPLVPELTGYIFTHWSDTPDGGPFDFSTPIVDEMAFYAVWARADGGYLGGDSHAYYPGEGYRDGGTRNEDFQDEDYYGESHDGYHNADEYYHGRYYDGDLYQYAYNPDGYYQDDNYLYDNHQGYYYQDDDYNYNGGYHDAYHYYGHYNSDSYYYGYNNYHSASTYDNHEGDNYYYYGYHSGYTPNVYDAPAESYYYADYYYSYEDYQHEEGYQYEYEDYFYEEYESGDHNQDEIIHDGYYEPELPEGAIWVRFNWNHSNHIAIRAHEEMQAIAAHEAYVLANYVPPSFPVSFALQGFSYENGDMGEETETYMMPQDMLPSPAFEAVSDGNGISIQPFNVAVSNIDQLRSTINSRAGNNENYLIRLNWGTIESTNQLRIIIPANTTITIENQTGQGRPTWVQNTSVSSGSSPTSVRHFDVYGTLHINNVALISTNSGEPTIEFSPGTYTGPGGAVSSGGIQIRRGGTLHLNDGALISGNNGTRIGGGGIDIDSNIYGGTAGARLFVNDGATISNNFTPLITGSSLSNGGGIRILSGGTMLMSGGTVSGNTGGWSGGVHVARTNGDTSENPHAPPHVIISGGTIEGNTARTSAGGVGVNVNQGAPFSFEISGGLITGNNATTDGGGIEIWSSAQSTVTLNMTRVSTTTVTNNRAGRHGGGIGSANNSIINISGTSTLTVDNNRAGENLQGIRVADGDGGGLRTAGEISIAGSGAVNIRDNSATRVGGGINISGTLTLGGTGNIQITGNNAGVTGVGTAANNHGGGINHGGTGAFNFTHTGTSTFVQISNNHAQGNGGGINRTSTHATAATFGSNVTINNNTAGQSGGGIHISAGAFTLDGANLRGNRSTVAFIDANATQGGGAISVAGSGTITMNSGTIGGPTTFNANSNRALRGGGVRLDGGTFNFNGGSIQYNISTNGTTNNASTNGFGGGVFISAGTFNMGTGTGTRTIQNNRSWQGGGGVSMRGGIFNMGANSIRQIQNNELQTGSSVGGGVHMVGGTFYIPAGTVAGYIQNNLPSPSMAGGGGGVHVGGTSTTAYAQFIANGPINIRGNTATARGGGVDIVGTGRVTFNHANAVIYNNRVSGSGDANGGGGVNIDGTATTAATANFTLTQGSIGSLVYEENHNRGRNGGGVRMTGGYFLMNGGNIQNNNASQSATTDLTVTGDGGGVWMSGGTFDMGTTTATRTIHMNSAINGGGVFISGGTFIMGANGVRRISSNYIRGQATDAGAGVHMIGGSMINQGATGTTPFFIDNNWGPNGGGIHVGGTSATPAHFHATGPISIRDNTATIQGGGIDVAGTGRVTLNYPNALVYANIANGSGDANGGGGVNIRGTATTAATANFTLVDGRIGGSAMPTNTNGFGTNRGRNGGGVRTTSGYFLMLGGNIQYNRATHNWSNAAANTGDGGGVWMSGGTFDMGQSTAERAIHGNQALNNGGGMFISGGTFNMGSLGTRLIQNNTLTGAVPRLGAGIHMIGGSAVSGSPTGTAELIIQNNTNATAGGGLHVGGTSATPAHFNATGRVSIRNHTVTVQGGGVDIVGTGRVTLNNNANTFIYNNRVSGSGAANGGGGVNVSGTATTAATANFTMTNGRIGGTAAATAADNGGNNRGRNGGGLRITSGMVRMTGGTIQHNRATHNAADAANSLTNTGDGGGVWMSGGTFEMGSLIATRTIQDNVALGNGGGVFMSGGTFDMGTSGSRTIQRNSLTGTTRLGAGVHMTGGTFNIPGNAFQFPATIQGNTNATAGGGVHVGGTDTTNRAHFNVTGYVSIRNHSVVNQGGGINVVGTGRVTLDHPGAVINNNTVVGTGATNGGGGVNISAIGAAAAPNFIMLNGRIGGTAAATDTDNGGNNRGHRGGGVRVASGYFLMAGGYIQHNRATFHNEGLTLTGNGGGVFISGGNFNMSTGETRTIRNNHALRGGGVAIAGGNFRMGSLDGLAPVPTAGMFLDEAWYDGDMYMGEAPQYFDYDYDHNDGFIGEAPSYIGIVPASGDVAQIINNTATTFGGGVYLAANVTFNMQSGTIADNQAEYGGGMHAATGTLNLSGTGVRTVHNNTADEDGGGVWIAVAATLTAQNTAFTSNTADGTYGMGGAIFTMKHQYENPLNLAGAFGAEAYDNVQILAGTTFSGNTAYDDYAPPSNAFDWTGIPGGSHSVHNHPLNNYDINFRSDGEPETFEFEFIKTDNITSPRDGDPLEGAGFQLYWRLDSTSDWEAEGDPVFSDSDGVVALTLRTTGQHRLIEVTPPPGGFTAPLGYWIIYVEYDNGYRVYRIGNYAGNPIFEEYPRDIWWVGNGFDFNLPLTGSAGTMLFSAFGIVLVGFAFFVLFVTKKKGKKSTN